MAFIIQHWLLIVLMIIVLLMIVNYERFFNQNAVKANITPHELVSLINRHHAVVVDLRAIDVFRQGHIINAINIPTTQLEKNARQLDANKEKPIVVIEGQAHTAAKAIKMLRERFPAAQIKLLTGGMQAWKSAGLPTQRG